MAKQQNVSLIDIVGMSDVMGRPRYRSNIGRFLLRWILDMSTDTYIYRMARKTWRWRSIRHIVWTNKPVNLFSQLNELTQNIWHVKIIYRIGSNVFLFWGIRTREKNHLHSFRYYFFLLPITKKKTHTPTIVEKIAREREREKWMCHLMSVDRKLNRNHCVRHWPDETRVLCMWIVNSLETLIILMPYCSSLLKSEQ